MSTLGKISKAFFSILLVLAPLLPYASWGAENDRLPLWQLTGKGKQAYLLGSFHFGTADMYPLPSPVETAYAACDTLVVELDITAIDPAQASNIILTQGMYPTLDANLRHVLNDADWQRLNHVVEDLGLPIEYIQQQRPWMVFLTLSQQLYLNLGFQQDYGIDWHFLQRAHRQNQHIVELETLADQLGYLQQLSEAEQLTLLQTTLHEFDEAKQKTKQLVANWRHSKLKEVDEFINGWFDDKPMLQRVQQILLQDRNRRMVTDINTLLTAGKTPFVVVGAGHLVGDGSVVELLRNQGYQLEQL